MNRVLFVSPTQIVDAIEKLGNPKFVKTDQVYDTIFPVPGRSKGIKRNSRTMGDIALLLNKDKNFRLWSGKKTTPRVYMRIT